MQASQHSDQSQNPALERCVQGEVLRPGSPEYEAARSIHNAEHDRFPALIVRAAGVADVLTTVNFARQTGRTLAVRSGGHSFAGYGTSDDLVLDLSGMKSIEIDAERSVARVEPGVTWGEFAWKAQEHGMAVSSGDTASVGVGGLTTGGGIGWLTRKYGLTIDHLLSAEVVTADGRLVTADPAENADLFWAIQGGGGNFGVVTSFTFRTHPVGMVVGGAVVYDATDGEALLRRYADYAASAPDELTTMAFIMNAPPAPFIPPAMVGNLVIIIGAVYTGDLEEGQRVVALLRSLATPVADLMAPMPYPAIYELTREAEVKGRRSDVRSMFMSELSDEAIATILEHLRSMPSPFTIGQLRVLGGAMARVSNDATAFAHRDKPYMFTSIDEWMDPAETARERAWSDSFRHALQPFADGAYVNFLGDEGEERIHHAYPEPTYARLAAIKRKYDPANFFHLNQNIKPA